MNHTPKDGGEEEEEEEESLFKANAVPVPALLRLKDTYHVQNEHLRFSVAF